MSASILIMSASILIAPGLDFTVKVVTDPAAEAKCRTVIEGKHGGAVRAKGGKKVRWSTTDPRGFTITVTEFDDNDAGGSPVAGKAFEEELPSGRPTFTGTLVKPDKGAAMLLFKYTIQIDGCEPADPPIIIER